MYRWLHTTAQKNYSSNEYIFRASSVYMDGMDGVLRFL